jgi:hypothetical protein
LKDRSCSCGSTPLHDSGRCTPIWRGASLALPTVLHLSYDSFDQVNARVFTDNPGGMSCASNQYKYGN